MCISNSFWKCINTDKDEQGRLTAIWEAPRLPVGRKKGTLILTIISTLSREQNEEEAHARLPLFDTTILFWLHLVTNT